MIGELWDEGRRELVDDDVDDGPDPLAEEPDGGEDIETLRAIRRCLPCEIDAGE